MVSVGILLFWGQGRCLNLLIFCVNCFCQSFIRDQAFDPKFWIAPCHRSKIVCNENKIMDLHGEPAEMKGNKQLIVCSKRHRWMKKKTVADVVEALIGAYLEDAGESAALAFMEAIGIEATTEYQEKLGIHSLSDKNLALIRMINISAIEELISYNFRQKGLLIEAFTHASFTTHHSRCYQVLVNSVTGLSDPHICKYRPEHVLYM